MAKHTCLIVLNKTHSEQVHILYHKKDDKCNNLIKIPMVEHKIMPGDKLIAWISGDAAGYTLNNLKKAHIQASLKDHSIIPDTLSLLKGRPERWHKPGLYSALTQLTFLECPRPANDNHDERWNGILRQMDLDLGQDLPLKHPSCSLVGLAPAAALCGKTDWKKMTTRLTAFTRDTHTMFCTLMAAELFTHDHADNLESLFLEVLDTTGSFCAGNGPLFFDLGLSPQKVEDDYNNFTIHMQKIMAAPDLDAVTTETAGYLSAITGQNMNRMDYYHPAAALSIALASLRFSPGDPGESARYAARFGGPASLSAALVSLVSVILHGQDGLDQEILKLVANRKSLVSMAEKLEQGSYRSSHRDQFITGEKGLSSKENEERAALMKHKPEKKKKKEQGKKGSRDTLSQHVVESWTKVDKGRWKRERKRLQNNDKNI